MSFKRRATGRSEMLKRNQQRKKKAAAKPAAKPVTQKQATKTAFSGKSLMETPKVRPVLKAPPAVPASKPAASTPAPKPAATNKPKTAASTPKPARQQTQVTASNRNKTDAGGMRYTGGRGSTPTAPTPVRRARGTGINRTPSKNKPTMTEAQRRAARLRARRGR